MAIKRQLKERLGRQWRVGDRIPPVKELARQLGTGQNNTHQAVRQLAEEGLLESRQRRGTYVLRTPHVAAIVREANDKPLAGRVVETFTVPRPDGFVRRMADAFCDTIEPTGATVRPMYLTDPYRLNISVSDDADSLVFFNPGTALDVACRPQQFITVVSTSARFQHQRDHRFDLISVDELHGGALAGRVMVALQCEKACFLGCWMTDDQKRPDVTSALRLYGFESTASKSVDHEHILLACGYSPQGGGKGYRRYRDLPEPKPKYIFAASDDLAIGFIAAAAADGLEPGKDYHIVGFDGQERANQMGEISLTTVKVPAAEMGRRAAQLLIERFADPDRPVHRLQLDCTLHRGTTTRTLA